MQRVVGIIFIIAGCSGLGLVYRQDLCQGLQELRNLKHMLEMLMSEIRYHKSTLPEACRQVGKRTQEPYGSALLSLYDMLREHNGKSFREGWRENMEKCLKKLPVSEKERDMVFGVGECEGFSDPDMQLRAMEQYRDMLESRVKTREAQLHQQGRMAAGLGIMSGLLLVIILI